MPTCGRRGWRGCGVLQGVHGAQGPAGELHHHQGRHAAAQLRQARPGRQVYPEVSGVQPQPVGTGVLQGKGLLHHL